MPIWSTFQASGGPPSGHCLRRPVSSDFPFRPGPRQPDHSADGGDGADGRGGAEVRRGVVRDGFLGACLGGFLVACLGGWDVFGGVSLMRTYSWSTWLSRSIGTATIRPSRFFSRTPSAVTSTRAASVLCLPVESVHVLYSRGSDPACGLGRWAAAIDPATKRAVRINHRAGIRARTIF